MNSMSKPASSFRSTSGLCASAVKDLTVENVTTHHRRMSEYTLVSRFHVSIPEQKPPALLAVNSIARHHRVTASLTRDS